MEFSKFQYLQWDDLFKHEKPFEVLIDLPEQYDEQQRTNLKFSEGRTDTIQDVRASIDKYTLDTHGFQFLQHETKLQAQDFFTKATVEAIYLPECENLLRSAMPGVDQVHFYNWLVRDSDSSSREGKAVNLNDPLAKIGPARVVHIDQTPQSAVQRVFMELPNQADRLVLGRMRLVNLWRPINGPVQDWPLALCDGRDVTRSSLVESDRVRRMYTGGTTFVLEEPNRKWYYLNQQDVNEVALFKNFDSEPSVTSYAPHTSFQPSTKPENVRPRQSIEVRAMVFTYPKDER